MESMELDTTVEEGEKFRLTDRDANLFIIDVSPGMFEKDSDSDSDESYFTQSLKAYGKILSQKLSFNKQDWMGLVFYNATKDWDHDPENKYILTVQKLAQIDVSKLKEILDILEHKTQVEDWFDPSCKDPLDISLHDVLWESCRSLAAIKTKIHYHQVVLITPRDNPVANDEPERNRIRLRAKTYANHNVHLQIVGVGGEDWNHDLFYRDIHALANNLEVEDSKRLRLEDLEIQVLFSARSSAHVKWTIGNGIEISTVIKSFSSTTKYLKKALMRKDTNEILDVVKHVGPSQGYGEDSDDEGFEDVMTASEPASTRKAVRIADKIIVFTGPEVRSIRAPFQPGIKLIGFKPIALDLIYHIKGAKFVGVEYTATNEEKELFAALLVKCSQKNLMAICVFTHQGPPCLVKLIPCRKFNGFYLYKIAFKEQVNNLEDYTKNHVYDNEENPEPTDREGVDLMTKILRKVRVHFDPLAFTSPKLSTQMAYIQALALDIEAEKPPDTTLPDGERMPQRLATLAAQFENMFGISSAYGEKRLGPPSQVVEHPDKRAKLDHELIKRLIRERALANQTKKVLTGFARSIGITTTGLKGELVERITEYFARQNAA